MLTIIQVLEILFLFLSFFCLAMHTDTSDVRVLEGKGPHQLHSEFQTRLTTLNQSQHKILQKSCLLCYLNEAVIFLLYLN